MLRRLTSPIVCTFALALAAAFGCRASDAMQPPPSQAAVEPPALPEVLGPAIGGIVVSGTGEPIAGASVCALPCLDARASSTVTDAYGRFLVELSTGVAHDLRVSADGFATYEERTRLSSYGGAHAAGERGVRIELRPTPRTEFHVLDARTQQPVLQLDLELLWKPIDGVQRFGGEVVHRGLSMLGGPFTCDADPATQLYSIRASGYAPERGAIEFDEPGSNVCTLRLRPAKPVRVRVLLGGAPAPFTQVDVLRESYRWRSRVTGRDEQWLTEDAWEAGDFGVSESGQLFPLSVAAVRTDEDGVATIDALPTGEHRFEFWGPNGARASLDPVGVVEAEGRDLGDVHLTPGATLRGRVSLADGTDPSTLSLCGSAWGRDYRAPIAADGSFTLAGLCAGRVRLRFAREPGLPSVEWTRTIDLAPGEDSSIAIEL